MIAMSALTVAAVIAVGWQAYYISRTALEVESFNQLVAVRELKADQIDTFFRTIRDQVTVLSGSRVVTDAMAFLGEAFVTERVAGSNDGLAELRRFYDQEFLRRAQAAHAPSVNLADLWPEDPRSLSMQQRYISENPHPVGQKFQLDRSVFGSGYDEMHGEYHPAFRDLSKRFGYYDLFLVDAKTGYIVYSVEKEIDYATSLIDGPYRNSNIAQVFNKLRDAKNANLAFMVDYESYIPSYGARASFLGSPIFVNGKTAGVLIVQVPLDQVDSIMTSGGAWSSVGLGKTGETYLVGPDFTLRSQSRFLATDREAFFGDIAASGVDEGTINRIKSLASAVGLLRVDTPGTRAALSGESGQQVFNDYRGQPVLSAYRQLDVPDVQWAIMSEKDQTETIAEALRLRNLIVTMVLVTALIAVVLAWLVARNLVAPLRALGDSANRLTDGDLEVNLDIDRSDEIGQLARSFEQMRRSLREHIQRQESAIAALATPMIPFRKEILIVPMVGLVDQSRISRLRESLVEEVHRRGARVAIIDLTGVPEIDAFSVAGLNHVTGAVALLGANVVLTGLRPEIAAQWASQEVQINNVVSERSLERGIARALEIIDSVTEHRTTE
jgi:methyl-accepting chemotaxis protein